jgi:nitrogen regulatory protein P-II 1
MTRIEAIIQPHSLDQVKEALAELGLSALTACEVKGLGRRRGERQRFRGEVQDGDLLPWLKLEVVIPTPFLPRVLDALSRAARGGAFGGKVIASPVDEAVRIRTGERGEGAL